MPRMLTLLSEQYRNSQPAPRPVRMRCASPPTPTPCFALLREQTVLLMESNRCVRREIWKQGFSVQAHASDDDRTHCPAPIILGQRQACAATCTAAQEAWGAAGAVTACSSR